MEFFYKKEVDLDEENNFAVDISKDNNVGGQRFNAGEEYLISGLELLPTEVDLTRWEDFKEIKAISDRINEAKEKKENIVKHGQIFVYLPDVNDFTEDLLITKYPISNKVYKYINLKTKKIDSIEFSDYQKAFEGDYLMWFSTKGSKMIYKFLLYDYSMLRNVGRGELRTQTYLQIMEEMKKI